MRADSRRRSAERVKAYRSGRFIQCTDDRSAGETSISFRGRLSHRCAHSYLAVPRSASIHSEFHRGSRVAFAPPTTQATISRRPRRRPEAVPTGVSTFAGFPVHQATPTPFPPRPEALLHTLVPATSYDLVIDRRPRKRRRVACRGNRSSEVPVEA